MERRKFITRSSLATLTGILGMDIVFGNLLPDKYIPLELQETDPFKLFGLNKEMQVLNDKPWNIEAQAHLLDDKVTPNTAMFIRNNGKIPEAIDVNTWTLTFDGESINQKKTYTLSELKTKFKHYTYQLTLECGGNGRSEFNPPAKGNQWTIGAVSSAKWTGIRLKDILAEVGVKSDAVYIGYHAADTHLSGDPSKEPISRGVPIAKALQEETILAFQMNGEDIPVVHGYPLRLIAGGYPASASGKWLQRISVRNKIHDGEKMTGSSYKVPRNPVAPGTTVKEEDMRIIESMPVKSLITYPKSGATFNLNKQLTIRGHAWAGEINVSKVEYSIDFGSTWSSCDLEKEVNRFAWQHFSAKIKFPQKGYYEVWIKATDRDGRSQPMLVPGWNPKGYLNNACHRIAVKVV
ncbi:sulfite oxidase [Cellulophaga baltica]|uniref:sulfite oxidase n=1 Tax=Cellulophaga baltica TaxID=76594 RepID=UPI0015F6A821|nr:sulfite oxidase [Cellulophaga baltica]MBA6315521.1 sulfite oxidase [Cellulophaga baltica]